MNEGIALSTTDENALRGMVQQLQDAWNAHDGNAFAAPFAADADYVIITGNHIRGRETIAGGHVGIFTTIYRDSENKLVVEQIRPLREDVALIRVQGHLVVRTPEGAEESGSRLGIVAVKTNGKWEFASFQNTPIRERPQ